MPDNIELSIIEKFSENELADYINQLIDKDFTSLVQLLYRIDISEKYLKEVLASNQDENAGKLIAALIAERVKQKQGTKLYFKQQNDIPEDEKW